MTQLSSFPLRLEPDTRASDTGASSPAPSLMPAPCPPRLRPRAELLPDRGHDASSPTSPWRVFLLGGQTRVSAASSTVRAIGGTVVSESLPAARCGSCSPHLPPYGS
jgi:hypothetical protein